MRTIKRALEMFQSAGKIIRIEDPYWEFAPDLTAPCFSNSSVYSNILIRCILFRFLY